VTFCWTQTQ